MSLLTRKDRETTGVASVMLALLALMFGFFAFAFAAHADNKKTGVPAGAVQVTLTEFAITPASISAPLNGKLLVTNSGSTVHNFNVQGTSVKTKDLAARRVGDARPEGLEGRLVHRVLRDLRPPAGRDAGDARRGRRHAAPRHRRHARHVGHGLQHHDAGADAGDERPDGREHAEAGRPRTSRS